MSEFDAALDAWVKGDRMQALSLWRMLAAQGDARAQYNLGVIFDEADGVERDVDLAISYYRDAAAQGYDDAVYNLAVLLEELRPEPESESWREMIGLYSSMAAAGRADAQFRIAYFYDLGEMLPRDQEQAARWYHAAAEQGHAEAAANLARCFAMGEGLDPSDPMAFKWYSIAAELGNANAARYRERVAKELSASERVRAGDFARQWLADFNQGKATDA